jgi:hypothetical protein
MWLIINKLTVGPYGEAIALTPRSEGAGIEE